MTLNIQLYILVPYVTPIVRYIKTIIEIFFKNKMLIFSGYIWEG